jgi:hypothetical protein
LNVINGLSREERLSNREIRLALRRSTKRKTAKRELNKTLQTLVDENLIIRTQEGKQSYFSPIPNREERASGQKERDDLSLAWNPDDPVPMSWSYFSNPAVPFPGFENSNEKTS